MAYSVKCYMNTGFNAVNIPDKPSLLDSMTSVDLPALDILQDWGLSSVRVRVSADVDIQQVDYCKIGNEYYAVGAPSMVASDVAELPLTYDAVTSAGGPSSITYLDGITERHTVDDDTMFKYTQEDELTAPRENLQLVSGGMLFKNTARDTITVVESTIDLYDLTKADINGTLESQTYTDSDGQNSVTVPTVPAPTTNTGYTLKDNDNSADIGTTSSAGTESFRASFVQRGIAVARALGVESGIVSQVQLPTNFISITESTTETGVILNITGNNQAVSSGLPFKYATPKNNRVLYGSNNKYGLITASGGKGEYLPEQIDDGNNSPNVRAIADPRPDGKPYFRYSKYMGDETAENFFNSAVSGLTWRNVPLVFHEASNSMLDTANFTNGGQTASQGYTYQMQQASLTKESTKVNSVLDAIKSAIDGIGKATKAKSGAEVITGLISGGQNLYNLSNSLDTQNLSIDNLNKSYNLAREKELQNYGYSQSVVVPTVMFPFNTSTIRDFIGNGVMVYRYRYSDNDVERIDKLLTMYGYKDTVALTADLFNKRTYFDYVRASGVSIGGDITVWKKALIAEQLNAGVRVWHVKPDPSHYTDNPIKGA